MRNMMREDLQELVAYSTLEKLLPYRLHANESPWDWLKTYPQELMDVVMNTAMNQYPEGTSLKLRTALREYTGAEVESITVGSGSDELIKMATEAFVSPGEKVIIHTPTFSEYGVSAMIASGQLVTVASDENFSIDVEAIIQKANAVKARMIFLCVPNNPTGVALSKEAILKVLNETEAIVISDEAYYEFCGVTVAAEAAVNPRLIVLRTLSKAFGLAALRVGYAIGHPETIECLNKVRMPYNLNALTQNIACMALKYSDRVAAMAQEMRQERQRVMEALEARPELKVYPSKANFILFKTPVAQLTQEVLEEKGVLIRRFNSEVMADCLRINIGAPEVNTMVVKTIQEVLDGTKRR